MALFRLHHEIICKKHTHEIIHAISTPPLSIGSKEYRKAQITSNNEFTSIYLSPVSQFPSEKNAGAPNIKMKIYQQNGKTMLNICFELSKIIRVSGLIFLPIIFIFGLAAVISFFVGEIDNFLISCIPWFVETSVVFIVWVSFRLSAKLLLRDIISRLS